MKKTLILLAGMALACNVIFAEEVKTEENALETVKKAVTSTGWDFSDSNVEFEAKLYDSSMDSQEMGTDSDLILKVKKQLDENTWISFKYDTDDSNPDDVVEFLANRRFNEYLEAQLDLNILVDDGLSIEEDDDSDKVWIKYYPNDKYTIKFSPYDIGMEAGDEFETDGFQVSPGVQLDTKLSDTTTFIVGIGANSVHELGGDDYTNWGYKLGMEYAADTMNVVAYLTGDTQDEDDIDPAEASTYNMALNIDGDKTFGKVAVDFEFAYQDLNKSGATGLDESDFAVYLKGSYDMGSMGSTSVAPYLAYKMVGEYMHFDDTDYSATIDASDVAGHGGLNSVELGVDFGLKGGLTITPNLEFITTDNEIFTDADGDADDSLIVLAVTAEVDF